MLPVYIHPLFLEVGPFIPLHAKPLEAFEDVPGILVFRPFYVRVLNAKNKNTAGMLCIEVVKQGGPCTTDMEIPCRAWCKPCFDH